MKELMIQKDFLSLLFKGDSRICFNPLSDGSGTAISDSYAIFVIPKENYFLNFGEKRVPAPALDNIIKGLERTEYVHAKYICSVPYKDGKKTGRVFGTKEGHYATIDNKYYRYFTAEDMEHVYVASRKDGIIIYDNDNFELKAYICPVNIIIEEFET